MSEARFIPLPGHAPRSDEESRQRARAFLEEVARRRTVRGFSSRPVPREIIETCLLAAGTAPSGAHRQPWRFVAVADPEVKRRIRGAAEREERAFYGGRAPAEWLDALAPLGTDARKPFLERAPWLIAVFVERWRLTADGRRTPNYYATESVGIATGVLLTALHTAGLVTLTHTPSPMGFLSEVLERPDNERAFLLVVAGHPAADARVPDLTRKSLNEIAVFVE